VETSGDSDLARVIDLTEDIAGHALSGEWDAVNELQRLQCQQIRAFFSAETEVIFENLEQIRRLKELMAQVIELAESEKARLAEQLRCCRKAESVNKAYKQNME